MYRLGVESSPDEKFLPDYSAPFEAVVTHCESKQLRFHTDRESKRIHFNMAGDAAVFSCSIRVTHDDKIMQVRVEYPVLAKDSGIRPAVAELVARVNHGMVLGHLDLDADSGSICFHLGHAVGLGLDDETIGCILSTAICTADKYFPALMRLMFAGNTPADAVYLSELDVHGEGAEDDETPTKPEARKPPESDEEDA